MYVRGDLSLVRFGIVREHDMTPSPVQRSERRGLSIIEGLLALGVLQVSVLAVTFAISAGRTHVREADLAVRAVEAAERLLEEVIAMPYADPDGASALGPESGESPGGFDNADDYHGYTDTVGEAPLHQFDRSVTMSLGSETIAGLGSISGLTVTVSVALQGEPDRTWTMTRFIPEHGR